MSHQKTKRIESPLKGKFQSMIEQHIQQNNESIFSSRKTQKRKPIFDETSNRSQISKSNSLRKKIFSKTQKNKQKQNDTHFSRLFQEQQLNKKFGDQQNYQEEDQYHVSEDSSIASSSIEDDKELAEVKRQLFPQTPKKKVTKTTQNMYFSRQFAISSFKQQLFEGQGSPPKSNLSLGTENIQKTTLRFNYQTPIKKIEPSQNYLQNSQIKSKLFRQYNSYHANVFNNQLSNPQTSKVKQNKKDIAKSLRQLHERMLQKNKICQNVDDKNASLGQENTCLRQENQKLKKRIKTGQQNKNQIPLKFISDNNQIQDLSNQNIFLKIKMQKAKNLLKNLLQIKYVENEKTNSIISIQSTLQQILKELQI